MVEGDPNGHHQDGDKISKHGHVNISNYGVAISPVLGSPRSYGVKNVHVPYLGLTRFTAMCLISPVLVMSTVKAERTSIPVPTSIPIKIDTLRRVGVSLRTTQVLLPR